MISTGKISRSDCWLKKVLIVFSARLKVQKQKGLNAIHNNHFMQWHACYSNQGALDLHKFRRECTNILCYLLLFTRSKISSFFKPKMLLLESIVYSDIVGCFCHISQSKCRKCQRSRRTKWYTKLSPCQHHPFTRYKNRLNQVSERELDISSFSSLWSLSCASK